MAVTSDGAHIGFKVFLNTKMGEQQQAGEMVEVWPFWHYHAHLVPEDGSLTCLNAGICHYWQREAPPGTGGLEADTSVCFQALPGGVPWLQ